jgi:hypothetical protein
VDLVYIAIFVILGAALDWAFFERTHNIMAAFWPIKEGYGYKETLFPRAYLTVISSVVVAVGSLDEPPNSALIIGGGAVFMLSGLYANYRVWRHGRSS